jgi:hypothetical protein
MWAALKQKVQGFRTLVASGAVAAVGAAQTFGMIDITPLVRVFVKDENQLGAVMVLLGIGFGYLRYLTKSSVGEKHPADPDNDDSSHALTKNVDAGM